MIRKFSGTIFKRAALLLAIRFTVALLWCGDVSCLDGKSTEDCASLICSLIHSDAPSTSDSMNDDGQTCSCVCHITTLAAFELSIPFYNTVHSAHPTSATKYSPVSPTPLLRPPIVSIG